MEINQIDKQNSVINKSNNYNYRQQGIIARPGLTGLISLGNTSFINSIIQCFSNTNPLTKYFLSNQYENDIKNNNINGNIVKEFRNLINEIWSGLYNSIEPKLLNYQIERISPNIISQSNDTRIILEFLLDGLHEDLNKVLNKPYIECKDYDDSSSSSTPDYDSIIAKEQWEYHKLRNDSIIVDLFHSQTRSKLVCQVCNKISITFEPYSYLSVPILEDIEIQQVVDIKECIKLLTREEELGPDNLWYCSNCKEHQRIIKKLDIWSTPSILIIQLEKFKCNSSSNPFFREKLDTFVSFPLNDLDLSEFVLNKNNQPPIYDLFAVSNHYGTLGAGHDTTFAFNEIENNWFKFDDSQVSEIINLNSIVSNAASILFYKRKDIIIK